MATPVHLTMTILEDGEEADIREIDAQYYAEEGRIRLSFRQELEEGKEPVLQVLTILLDEGGRPHTMNVSRVGTGFSLLFQAGETTTQRYRTPAGDMDVCLHTLQMEGTFAESSMAFSLSYELMLAGQKQPSRTIRLEF